MSVHWDGGTRNDDAARERGLGDRRCFQGQGDIPDDPHQSPFDRGRREQGRTEPKRRPARGGNPSRFHLFGLPQSFRKDWTEAERDVYLADPLVVPGMKMFFKGLPNADQRADVFAYLKMRPPKSVLFYVPMRNGARLLGDLPTVRTIESRLPSPTECHLWRKI
jgi:hypothetical protein